LSRRFYTSHVAQAFLTVSGLCRGFQALILAMQTEDAAQYRPRLQSPAAKQAIAEPALHNRRMPGKIMRLGTMEVRLNGYIGWMRTSD